MTKKKNPNEKQVVENKLADQTSKETKPQEVDYMEIRIAEYAYKSWIETLVQGKQLPSEVAGLLLGRARPIYKAKLEEKGKGNL